MVQLMLSFIGSSQGKPERHSLISLAPHLLLCQMDDCSGILLHICSGSRTLQGIMLCSKEISLFMEIKVSDSSLHRNLIQSLMLSFYVPSFPSTEYVHQNSSHCRLKTDPMSNKQTTTTSTTTTIINNNLLITAETP